MVIKNLENKIKLVGIVCSLFLVGCIVISISSILTARGMVSDAQKKVYVLDGNVPILVERRTMDETLEVEAKKAVESAEQEKTCAEQGERTEKQKKREELHTMLSAGLISRDEYDCARKKYEE